MSMKDKMKGKESGTEEMAGPGSKDGGERDFHACDSLGFGTSAFNCMLPQCELTVFETDNNEGVL
jgi:hypothetical protein